LQNTSCCWGKFRDPLTAAAAGVATGTYIVCADWVHVTFVRMGSTPVLLAILMMWLLVHLAWVADLHPNRLTSRALVWAMLISTGLLMHLWQGLAALPLAAGAVMGASRLRTGPRPMLPAVLGTARRALTGTIAIMACAGMAMASLVGLLHTTSVAAVAAAEGDLQGPPLSLLVLSVATPLVYLRRGGTCERKLVFGLWAGGVGLVLLLLVSSSRPLDLAQYYPRKAISVMVVLTLPWLFAAAGELLVKAHAWTAPHIVTPFIRQGLRPALAAGTGALLVSTVLGALTGPGLIPQTLSGRGADAASGRRLAVADLLREQEQTTYLPVAAGLTASGDYPGGFVISKLLRFTTGQPETSGRLNLVCQDAALLTRGGRVVVATDLPASVMRAWTRARGCGELDVLHLAGGDAGMVEVITKAISTRGPQP
jgi:hypothetical protein